MLASQWYVILNNTMANWDAYPVLGAPNTSATPCASWSTSCKTKRKTAASSALSPVSRQPRPCQRPRVDRTSINTRTNSVNAAPSSVQPAPFTAAFGVTLAMDQSYHAVFFRPVHSHSVTRPAPRSARIRVGACHT